MSMKRPAHPCRLYDYDSFVEKYMSLNLCTGIYSYSCPMVRGRIHTIVSKTCTYVTCRSKWKDILSLVHCEVITSCHGDGLDAYLLR